MYLFLNICIGQKLNKIKENKRVVFVWRRASAALEGTVPGSRPTPSGRIGRGAKPMLTCVCNIIIVLGLHTHINHYNLCA